MRPCPRDRLFERAAQHLQFAQSSDEHVGRRSHVASPRPVSWGSVARAEAARQAQSAAGTPIGNSCLFRGGFRPMLRMFHANGARSGGACHAPVSHRARIRRAGADRSGDHGHGQAGQRRDRHPVAVLVSERRQAQDLLPVRGAECRGDTCRRRAARHTGGYHRRSGRHRSAGRPGGARRALAADRFRPPESRRRSRRGRSAAAARGRW